MFYNSLRTVLVTALFCFSTTSVYATQQVKIVAITNDFASIAKAIGGRFVQVDSLVSNSRDLHSVHPKPSMVLKLKKADLLIRLGMGQDSWIDGLIHTTRKTSLFKDSTGYLDASIGIPKLEVPTDHIDGNLGDVHLKGNPHYWLAPSNGIIIGKQILNKLIEIDKENAEDYTRNYSKFVAKTNQKTAEWKKQLSSTKHHQFITYHKVWPYFFKEFGLTSIGELEPLPGIPPTTSHLFKLKNDIKKEGKPTILVMANFYNQSIGKTFSKKMGAHLSVVQINAEDKNGTAYHDLFDSIIEEILEHD